MISQKLVLRLRVVIYDLASSRTQVAFRFVYTFFFIIRNAHIAYVKLFLLPDKGHRNLAIPGPGGGG